MDLSRVLRETILVEHVTQSGPPDAMGDPTEESTWSSYRGWVWQTSTTERTANGQIETESWQLALERSAAGQIDAGDRIVAGGTLAAGLPVAGVGELFDVAGPPWPVLHPRTLLTEYVIAKLERSA